MRMPERGDILDDRYLIERLLGQGGMGSVFRARHVKLDKEFAIKVLLPKLSVEQEYRTRFTREARIASRLNHPNAVQVYDTGEWRGLAFMVMEFLQGRSLYSTVPEGTRAPLDLLLELGIQLAEVLHAAHHIGLVHRDLKPENIMVQTEIDQSLRFVVVDFGLAFVQRDEELSRMTRDSGVISGTPAYLSPEQASSEEIGPPSDIYSLGCILYEMLTGRPPFTETTVMRMLSKHMFVQPEPPRVWAPDLHVPPQLEELILLMLEKDPSRRPEAAQVLQLLREVRDAPLATGRGRERELLLPRELRMLEVPTSRFMSAPTSLAEESEPGSYDLVAFYNRAPDPDTVMALGANGMRCRAVRALGDMNDCQIIFAPQAAPDTIQTLSRALPTVTTALAGDMNRIAELLRAGAVDVLPEPVELQDLVRKLRRAVRKSRRQGRT